MPETCRLYLDQMLRIEVAEALVNEGHDVLRASDSQNAINLLLPFLRLHSPIQFKNNLVILSKKRSKWIYTASED